MRDLTLFEALMGGAFDRLNWQHSGEFDQNFSQKSNARGFAREGGGGEAWAVLELTGIILTSTYTNINKGSIQYFRIITSITMVFKNRKDKKQCKDKADKCCGSL